MYIRVWSIYKQISQSYIRASDAQTSCYNNAIKDVSWKVTIVNDTLLYGNTIEKAFLDTWHYLQL